ncbi:hypothetical protein SLS62_011126 [Diatrype stigma]|uniref:FAD-binding PCMH-type domain-containing protein n=1 Tax=Diatrype stigma TaxID=117547 RepID=A0AAN9YFZ1_9PEZI
MAIETIESFCSQAVSHMKAGLGPKVLLPTDPAYIVREESYWASNTRLKPACILVPESAEEVSSALKSLVAAQQRFAIRSGGHSPSPGANNMADGVTIDLSHLNTVTFDPATETAHIGAGAKWTGVYEELLKYGRAVAGGRSGDVGVSGLLLGGGSSWMAARYGWACDAVLAFEIVLADGRIVTVDKDSNTDLYQALKGGSNNFGIVTSFVMTALPTGQVWAGIAATPKEAIPEVVDVMYNFTEGNSKHQDSYLMIVIGYFPAFKDNVASTAFLEAKGDANAAEFDGWRKLPKIMDTSKITTIYDMAANITLPPNYQ